MSPRTSQPQLADLSVEQKRQLLAQRLQKKAPQRFPLSFAQQRLWFLDRLQPGTTVYAIPAALRLQGDLYIHGGFIERRLGLTSMRERAESLGGTLTIETAPRSGTTVRLEVPGG